MPKEVHYLRRRTKSRVLGKCSMLHAAQANNTGLVPWTDDICRSTPTVGQSDALWLPSYISSEMVCIDVPTKFLTHGGLLRLLPSTKVRPAVGSIRHSRCSTVSQRLHTKRHADQHRYSCICGTVVGGRASCEQAVSTRMPALSPRGSRRQAANACRPSLRDGSECTTRGSTLQLSATRQVRMNIGLSATGTPWRWQEFRSCWSSAEQNSAQNGRLCSDRAHMLTVGCKV